MEFLDRIPVPNLRVYTTISFAVLSCSLYYAAQVVKGPTLRTNHTSIVDDVNDVFQNGTTTYPRSRGMHFKELGAFMVQEPSCMWE